MIIYLIRHGRQNSTDCNVDVPLSKEGRLQASLLGKRMQKYPIDALYTSNLIRAVETGKIAFADRKQIIAGHRIRKGLAEIDFGSLTGKEDAVVKAFYREYYQRQLQLFQDRKKHKASGIPETIERFTGDFFVPVEDMCYPDGENGAMVMERVMPVVQEWLERKEQHIAVVTHGGIIRILLCVLFGGDFSRRLLFGTSLENCSITQIHYDEEKHAFFLDRFNDYAHIETEPALMRNTFLHTNQ